VVLSSVDRDKVAHQAPFLVAEAYQAETGEETVYLGGTGEAGNVDQGLGQMAVMDPLKVYGLLEVVTSCPS
jgi:hypothetical protein